MNGSDPYGDLNCRIHCKSSKQCMGTVVNNDSHGDLVKKTNQTILAINWRIK